MSKECEHVWFPNVNDNAATKYCPECGKVEKWNKVEMKKIRELKTSTFSKERGAR